MNEQEWLESIDIQKMIGAFQSAYEDGPLLYTKVSDRKLRLFAVACCRNIWHKIEHKDWRHAVEVAERFADNDRDGDSLVKVHRYSLPLSVDRTIALGAVSVREATLAYRATAPHLDFSNEPTYHGHVQANLLRDIIGNPFRPPITDTRIYPGHWLYNPNVKALALDAYENRRSDGFLDPVLLHLAADALEDAGCGAQECESCRGNGKRLYCGKCRGSFVMCGEYLCPVCSYQMVEPVKGVVVDCSDCKGKGYIENPFLTHLRTNSRGHVRGCWAIDLILGKE